MIVPEIALYLSDMRVLCQQYAVKRMSIIGSATDPGKFSPETSDLDCLVLFLKEEEEEGRLLQFADALEQICGRPVEIVLESTLAAYSAYHPLRQIVEKSKILVYDIDHEEYLERSSG